MEKLLWEMDSFRATFFSRKEIPLLDFNLIVELINTTIKENKCKEIKDKQTGKSIYVIKYSEDKYLHIVYQKNRLDFEIIDSSDIKNEIKDIQVFFEEFIQFMKPIFKAVNSLEIVRFGIGIDIIYIAESSKETTAALQKYFDVLNIKNDDFNEITLKTSKKLMVGDPLYQISINETLVGSSSEKIIITEDSDSFPEGEITNTCIIKIDINSDAFNKHKIMELESLLNQITFIANKKLGYGDKL